MHSRSVLCSEDHVEFLVRLSFAPLLSEEGADYLGACVARAHLDIRPALTEGGTLRRQAEGMVRSRLEDLRQGWSAPVDQEAFDRWHCSLCQDLAELYRRHGHDGLPVGLAQRWVNLALKYLHILGERRVPGLERLYALCHAPLDGVLVSRLAAQHGFPPLSAPWDRLDDYDEYLRYQQRLRRAFILVPLDVELLLWLDRPEDAQRLV